MKTFVSTFGAHSNALFFLFLFSYRLEVFTVHASPPQKRRLGINFKYVLFKCENSEIRRK